MILLSTVQQEQKPLQLWAVNSNSCKVSNHATAWPWSTHNRMTSKLLAQLLLFCIQFFPTFQADSAEVVSMFTSFIQSTKQLSEVLNWLAEPPLHSKNQTHLIIVRHLHTFVHLHLLGCRLFWSWLPMSVAVQHRPLVFIHWYCTSDPVWGVCCIKSKVQKQQYETFLPSYSQISLNCSLLGHALTASLHFLSASAKHTVAAVSLQFYKLTYFTWLWRGSLPCFNGHAWSIIWIQAIN